MEPRSLKLVTCSSEAPWHGLASRRLSPSFAGRRILVVGQAAVILAAPRGTLSLSARLVAILRAEHLTVLESVLRQATAHRFHSQRPVLTGGALSVPGTFSNRASTTRSVVSHPHRRRSQPPQPGNASNERYPHAGHRTRPITAAPVDRRSRVRPRARSVFRPAGPRARSARTPSAHTPGSVRSR